MKIELEFMELVLLQKINKHPGEIDWDTHPVIDKLMKAGLVNFHIGNTHDFGVYISDLGRDTLNKSLPYRERHAVSDDSQLRLQWN